MIDQIGIYIHIPYCRVICPYCDFVKKRTSGDVPDKFTDALCREINSFQGPKTLSSVFFGGGTPSLLTPADTERIFETLRKQFSITEAEITIEVNPDDVTPEMITLWQSVGINRLSLGVQSFDDAVLKFLGRNHDSQRAHDACALLADAYENWSLDLIFGCKPSDTWQATLETALTYAPPHISTYGLTYEENTPFWQQRSTAIDDDTALEQYRQAHALLSDYAHYEVSNFARPGFESTHNKLYWRNEAYAGFGPGAVSFLNDIRITNPRSITAYENSPTLEQEKDQLTPDEIKLETLIQHFRTKAGIHETYYQKRFHEPITKNFAPALTSLMDRGLVTHQNKAYTPTQKGYELNNEIALALIPER